MTQYSAQTKQVFSFLEEVHKMLEVDKDQTIVFFKNSNLIFKEFYGASDDLDKIKTNINIIFVDLFVLKNRSGRSWSHSEITSNALYQPFDTSIIEVNVKESLQMVSIADKVTPETLPLVAEKIKRRQKDFSAYIIEGFRIATPFTHLHESYNSADLCEITSDLLKYGRLRTRQEREADALLDAYEEKHSLATRYKAMIIETARDKGKPYAEYIKDKFPHLYDDFEFDKIEFSNPPKVAYK